MIMDANMNALKRNPDAVAPEQAQRMTAFWGDDSWRQAAYRTEQGLFATLDGGENWFRMKNNIPEFVLARDLQIQPTTHDLIIATHGRGIFILDDIRTIRNLNKEIWDKDIYIFPTPDIVLNNGKFGWGGPSVSGGWEAYNPYEHPTFDYFFKQRLNSGKVTLEVYNDKEELIQSMPGTIRRGINKVKWNLRGTPPKVASGSKKMDGAGFTAPMVLPGKYTLKLIVNEKVYTSTFYCVHDTSNKELSIEKRKLVFEKAMQLLALYNNVNHSVDSINTIQLILKSDSLAYTKRKQAIAFYEDLEKHKSELMSIKKTSIFAQEKQLREKVSQLYSNFCYMEASPNQTQLDAIADLESDYKTKSADFKKIMDKHLPQNPEIKLNKKLD
jgi:hypothetical protein